MASTTANCPHCGRRLEKIAVPKFLTSALGQIQLFEDCDCEGAKAAATEREAERAQENEARSAERFRRRMEHAGIRERYQSANHEKAGYYAQKVDDGQSLYFVGKFGVGKTYLACAIARKLLYNKKTVRFATMIDLLLDLQSTYGLPLSEKTVLDKYSSCDVLIIDDLGKEQPTRWALTRILAIINNREANMKPVIITSNLRVSEITNRLGAIDPSDAEAIASRLAGMCEVVDDFGSVDRRLQ